MTDGSERRRSIDMMDRRRFCHASATGLAVSILSLPPARAASEASMIIEAANGTARLVPEPAAPTAVWGYDGKVPGPVVRVVKGGEVKVRLVNKLAQPTTMNWHGVRIANAMDGVAGLTQKAVLPGETFDYRFAAPDAGFYWYHPHVMPDAAEQIGRGLYGVLIVDEPDPPKVERDLIVVLDDWSLDAKGVIRDAFAETGPSPAVRPLVTVNTAPAPQSDTVQPGTRMRLRLLNACSARICAVAFENLRPMIVAIDGQPSELFQPMNGVVPIGPGSRFEVMVDLPGDAGKEAALVLMGDGTPNTPLLRLKTRGASLPTRPPIVKLPANPLLPTRIALERSLRREIVIGRIETAPPIKPGQGKPGDGKPGDGKPGDGKPGDGKPGKGKSVASPSPPNLKPTPSFWTMNGVASNGFSAKPLFSVPRGNAVTLTFVNKTTFAQQMHIHGHVWRLLHDLDDGWDPYWRDSVLLTPGKTKHVAFIADNPGKWAIESLMLERQVSGLATWFEVV